MSEQPTHNADSSPSKLSRRIAIATVTVTLVLMCIVVAVQQNSQERPLSLLQQNTANQSAWMLQTRGNKKTTPQNSWLEIREGLEYYHNKDFGKAIPIFQDYLENNAEASDYYTIEFYLAVSYFGQGETERSTALLEELVQNKNIEIKEDATWYLSLAYTKDGATEAAKQQLELLAESAKYAAKVRKLLHPTKTNVALN